MERRPVILIVGLCALLTACSESKPAPSVKLLATDVHLAVGGEQLTLPFAALEKYAYRGMSFSLNREGDRERAKKAVDDLIYNAKDPDKPLALLDLSVVVRTYGSNDFDSRQREMCPLLTRTWARSVCDNPWSPIQQALPANRFALFDLDRLSKKDADRLFNCVEGSEPLASASKASAEAAIVCRAVVYPMSGNVFHRALMRIHGSLGAIWTVWGHGQHGESAEAMASREGKALVSFVKNALGSEENFKELHADMCRLRRPGSVDSPKGTDC